MPPYQRCGDIVCLWKRKTRTFAFQCIYCPDPGRTTNTFKDFKSHLETEHSDLFEDWEKEDIKPWVELRTLRSSAGNDPEAVASAKEEDPLETEMADQMKLEESSPADSEAEQEIDRWSDGDSQSVTSLESTSQQLETVTSSTDTSFFWLQEHPIMLAFIAQLEQQRLLWDLSMVEYKNYRRRRKASKKIADGLNAQFALNLTGQDVSAHVKLLRDEYRREKQRVEQPTDPPATAEWFYEKLHFLARGLPRQRQPKMLGKSSKAEERGSVALLNHAQNLKLIELYRQCRPNWDMQDMTCRLRTVRKEASDRLLELCRKELKIPLEPAQLQLFIRRLRNTYHQEKLRRLQSERLGKVFRSRSRYYEKLGFLEPHMAPFQCDLCPEMLSSVDGYRVHRSKHDGSLPFVCPTCGRGFSKCGNCTIHLRRHTQDYHLSCEECGKRFATTTDLQVHRRSHTGERPYCCHICGGRFSTVSFLERHKRRHEQRSVAKCHICGKGFFERTVLRDHIKGHLDVRDKECDVCHKRFTSAKYLRRHKEIHDKHKRYLCKLCGKGFAQYAGLSGHMKSHVRKKETAGEGGNSST
ncbi:uncharacterized protein RhoGAP16F isoform X2 [Drosophila kikkawai]|uniref:Uncharacterized protein RhoGAP16F isoform X2 n=1 Tax=Drosophila kikkawai TaxID=30033 RepID=A0A6P4JJH9_DROKI|nr:myoneurin isoform X1 [Drosophila kikkawai]